MYWVHVVQYICCPIHILFKKCYPIHIYNVAQYIYSVTQYIYPIHILMLPNTYSPTDTCNTYILLSNTYFRSPIHMGYFYRFLPIYVLGTRYMYWTYVLGNTPYVLGNTFLYVLGNKNVTQYIYPIYISCNPIHMDVIQHIYPIHIFICIGVHICIG